VAEINLPSPGQRPWNLNPAIEAVNAEVEGITDLVTDGRLSEDGLAAAIGGVVAPAVAPKANTADVAAAYTRKRRDQFAKRRARPGVVTRVALPTTGGVAGTGFGWQDAPIRIFKSGKRYFTDFDVAAFKNTDPSLIYVDPVNGSQTNDGLTRATAKKSLNQGVTTVANGGTVMVLGKGIFDRTAAFNGGNMDKSVNIIAEYPGEIAFAMSDTLAWTLDQGSTYVASRTNVSAVVDMLGGVSFGLAHGVRYTQAASLAECRATRGSWFQDGANLYVTTYAGTIPDNKRHLALLKVQGWRISSGGSGRVLYLEGMSIIGGEVGGNLSLSGAGPIDIYMKDVKLLHATDAAENAFNALGNAARYMFSQRVTVHGSRKDGFNYSGPNCRFIEVDCHSYGHGLWAPADPRTNNASTAHLGSKGIRIGGTYHETTGAVLADVQEGTQSVHYSCTSYDSLSGTGDSYDSVFCAQQTGADMWAFGCDFFGAGGWDVVALPGTRVVLDECSFDSRTGAAQTTVTNEV
jgi:hypothetical protein